MYHGDERGSVVAITDTNGAEVQGYRYGPYGDVVASSGSIANEFQYLGRHGVMADENGLLHMNARYYSPEARRFLTEDPIGLAGGPNVYAYADGDPVNRVDPSGLAEEFLHPDVVRAINEIWLASGVERNLRDAGYFIPEESATVRLAEDLYLDRQTMLQYVSNKAGLRNVIKQTAIEFEQALGRPNYWGRVPANKALVPVESVVKTLVPLESPIKALVPVESTGKALVPMEEALTGWFLKSAGTVKAPASWTSSLSKLGGSVSSFLGKANWVTGAGMEGWNKGREVGRAPLIWDGGQGKFVTVDEGLVWLFNRYNGWVDQPEMFDYVNPQKYVEWKNKKLGDNLNSGNK